MGPTSTEVDMNKQNDHLWGSENPYSYIIKPLHSQCVTTWCALLSHGLIGPSFTEGSVIQVMYREMLDTHFIYCF
jgi:hypothetical protein